MKALIIMFLGTLKSFETYSNVLRIYSKHYYIFTPRVFNINSIYNFKMCQIGYKY